jgi:PAS domain S-box-containing protein
MTKAANRSAPQESFATMVNEQDSYEKTLLATILDSATDVAIITLDQQNTVTLWNEGAERILGWTAEEMIGSKGEIIFTPEDREAGVPQAEIQQALAKGRAEDERWHVRKDRSRFWASGLMMPIKGGVGFLKIMRDRTERREAEQALRESEERFRTLAEGIPQLVFRSLSLGERTYGSPQWVAFTGLPEANSLGLGWMDAVHPADYELTKEAWAEAEVSGELYVEHRFRRAIDGQYKWFQTRAKKPKGEREWLGTSTDIDELKRLKERQDILLKELHHRTGNILAVVTSIARRTAQSASSIENFSRLFEDRIQALSRVQQQIAREDASVLELGALLRLEFEALGLLGSGQVVMEGPSCILSARQAETLALAIHELATNALKYGALSHAKGKLVVSWSCPQDGERALEWIETEIRNLDSEKLNRRGYGRELIEVALPYALGAQTKLEFLQNGVVRCKIGLPPVTAA